LMSWARVQRRAPPAIRHAVPDWLANAVQFRETPSMVT